MRQMINVLSLSLLLGVVPVHAHEFWFTPVQNPIPLQSSVDLALEVGQYFEGDLVGFSAPAATAFGHYTKAGREDLLPRLPKDTPVGSLQLPMTTAGMHLLAYDSQPRMLELPAEKFHAYLHDEGLDFIKVLRDATGTAATPGRERYRRNVKTLIQVGPRARTNTTPDMTYAAHTGQRLELVPLNNPLTMKPGEALGIQVLFDGQPLAGALLKAWHKRTGQTLLIRSTTSSDGKVTFNLPYRGGWMVSVVHMLPATDVQNIDWDSWWGNLSFSLP
jgi:uncharacterized GH25 family protein